MSNKENKNKDNYYVTALPCKKRYPTYQFHGVTINDKLPAEKIMGICVLEVMKWLRKRIAGDKDPAEINFPPEIDLPEPEDFESFDPSRLKSFTLNLGFSVEALYSENNKLWAFCLTETDMGLGDKRQPVTGRNFETNIFFRATGGCVEASIQTVCSEPESSQEPCEVLRPAVMPALFNNPNIGLRHILNVTPEPIAIESAKDFKRIKEAAENADRELPIVFITTPKAKKPDTSKSTPKPSADMPSAKPSLMLSGFSPNMSSSLLSGGLSGNMSGGLSAPKLDMSGIKLDARAIKETEKKPDTPKNTPKPPALSPALSPAEQETAEQPQTIDAQVLAEKCASFAFICTVPPKMFDSVRAAFCDGLARGDVLIVYGGGNTDVIPFDEISENVLKAQWGLIHMLRAYPKRRVIKWGSTLFLTDAKIFELQQRRNEKISHEDKIKDRDDEIAALTLKLKEATEAANDCAANENEIREKNKQITALERRLKEAESDIEALRAAYEKYKSYSDNVGSRINFYRERAALALEFPPDKDKIPEFVGRMFPDTIFLHDRASAALAKYGKSIDYSAIFDGIYFLHGYALYCQGKITEYEFGFYSEEYGWKVMPCGDNAINMFPNEYKVIVEKNNATAKNKNAAAKITLKYHIRCGRDSERWTRIYFCYDEDLKRVVIGYLPDHLHTSADKT